MDDLQAANTTPIDQAAMTARVYADAERAFGGHVTALVLERCARDAVADLWVEGIRITRFVPVLALRQVRDMLDRPQATFDAVPAVDRVVGARMTTTVAARRGLTDADVLTDRDTLTPD